MNNLFFQMFYSLGNPNSLNTGMGNSTAFTAQSTADFSTVLSQLNKNLDSIPLNSDINLSKYGINSSNNTNSTMVIPDINAIVEKIKNDKSSSLDVQTQVEQYLLSSYGGSKAGVIENLSGIKNLPPQAITMQNQIFREIVSKVSSQVGMNLCKDKKSSDLSYFADDSTDSSTNDDGLFL